MKSRNPPPVNHTRSSILRNQLAEQRRASEVQSRSAPISISNQKANVSGGGGPKRINTSTKPPLVFTASPSPSKTMEKPKVDETSAAVVNALSDSAFDVDANTTSGTKSLPIEQTLILEDDLGIEEVTVSAHNFNTLCRFYSDIHEAGVSQ